MIPMGHRAIVGDAPGGRMTPYSETIIARGGPVQVLSAPMTRALGGRGPHMAGGGMLGGNTVDISLASLQQLAGMIASELGKQMG